MVKNIFMEIEYDGSGFFGLQIQNRQKGYCGPKDEPTVQEALEAALFKLFCRRIRITYSGRTDRGVHALAQAVNFKVETRIPLRKIKTALNTFLPDAVRVKTVKRVPADFHARFRARSKTYRYRIINSREQSVFERGRSWHIPDKLDLSAVRKCSGLLTGERDFSLFARQASAYRDCVRRINFIKIRKRGKDIIIDINGNGFLRCMVRNMVAFLVRAGKHEFSLTSAGEVLKGKTGYMNRPAPAWGLYLYKVYYE